MAVQVISDSSPYRIITFGQRASSIGCRTLFFNREIKDKVLANHTLRTIKPINKTETCMHMCYQEPLCSSVNYCNKSGETPYCELIDTDQSHGVDMIDMNGCSFQGTKTSCITNPCPANATCSGDYRRESKPYKCICPEGYEGDYCEKDIDECKTSRHNCPAEAFCSNTIGGFNCTCKIGFHGDGIQCEDINECASDKYNLSLCETCTNIYGSYICACKPGSEAWIVLFDFETGKQGWTTTGTVFNNQPTYEDNSKKRGKPSNVNGKWWIGGYEHRPSPSDPAGKVQGDGPVGTMTSPPFKIRGSKLRFLIGGGCNLAKERAELLIGEKVAAKHTGNCNEFMVTKEWDVRNYNGQEARLRLVDENSGGWGHINFDHVEGYFC